MSRSARQLIESLTDSEVGELDLILTAACMAVAFRNCPRKVFKKAKSEHSGRLKRMLNAFQKSKDVNVILENHARILEVQHQVHTLNRTEK